MDLSKWITTPDLENKWKSAFSDLPPSLSGKNRLRIEAYAAPKGKHKGNPTAYWVELREPLPDVRLIAYTIPVGVSPVKISLRVWVLEDANTAYQSLKDAGDLTILGERTIRYLDATPPDSWRGQLEKKGITLRGIRYELNLTKILDDEHIAFSKLRSVGEEFCAFIVRVVIGASERVQTMGPAPALQVSSIALSATVAQEPAETPSRINIDDWVTGEVAELVEGSEEAARSIGGDPRFSNVLEKTRIALVNARVGQGGYRRRMLQLWDSQCALTGCDVSRVLIASHARSWSDCESVEDCLNEYNGLLLVATFDRLFDVGLISFGDDGTLLVNTSLSARQRDELGLSSMRSLRFVHKEHHAFLASHRCKHGFIR